MRSKDLIHDNLKKSADRVLARVEDMREFAVVFPTPEGGPVQEPGRYWITPTDRIQTR